MLTKTATEVKRKRSQFSGIEDKKYNTRAKNLYLNQYPGTHFLDILAVKSEQNENTGVFFFAAEMKVTESTNPALKDGDVVSIYADTVKFEGALFMKTAKSFAAAAYGIPVDTVDENELLAIVSEDQPAVGTKIKTIVSPDKYGARNKSGKKPGEPKLTKDGEIIYRVDYFSVAKPPPGKAA